jgi:hypothetical protein
MFTHLVGEHKVWAQLVEVTWGAEQHYLKPQTSLASSKITIEPQTETQGHVALYVPTPSFLEANKERDHRKTQLSMPHDI